MVPGSWPYGVPSSSLGFASYASGPNPFAIPSAPAYAFAPPLYGLEWSVYPPGYYYYQAQTSSAPPTYGGLIWNGGFPSTTYPASTFPNQTRVPTASSGTTLPTFSAPQPSSMSAGTTPWGSSTSSTSFTFPSQPQASSTSAETTFWGSSPQSTAPTFASPSQPQASSSSIGSTSQSIFSPQPSSSSTGTTFWDSIRSAVQPTFTFPSQTQAPATTPHLFGARPQTTPSSGPSTTSFPPRGSRVAAYAPTPAPTPDDSGYSGNFLSISAMPVYRNKSHEELRLEDYQTLSDKGPQANPPLVASTVIFPPRGVAVFSDVPASNDEKFISISATPAYSNKSHEELRLDHYNASRPIQPATSNGEGTLCSCGSLLQKQKPAGAETLVNLLTSALSTNSFPIGIGLAGQFSPDTPVLCQLHSSSSVRPTGAATSSSQTSSSTAFTWPELGCNTAPHNIQNAPETLASTDKISGQSTEGAFKSGIPSTSPFGVPFTFPPSATPTDPQETLNAPDTLASTDKISGKSTERAFKSGIPSTSLFGGSFVFPPSAPLTDPWKTQNALETLASPDKISGQSPEGAFKSGIPSTSPFGVPFTFLPSTATTFPQKTQNALSTEKISGQSTEGAFKSGIPSTSPFGVPFTFPPSTATTIPQKTQNALSTEKISGQSTEGAFKSGIPSTSPFGVPFMFPPYIATTFPQKTQNALSTKLCNLSFLEQKSSKSETGNSESSSAKLKLNISVPLDDFEEDEVSTHDAEAMMPKIRSLDYYTIPAIHELVEKERLEPGFCSRVKDFVVGRRDYGCIKFLGETDVRNLDLESLVKFDTREVTLLEGDGEKSETGPGLNKPSEVTLLNVKCMDKSTGIQCLDGPKVDKFRQMLIRKAAAAGVEFVSYEPAAGEWKFKVQHF